MTIYDQQIPMSITGMLGRLGMQQNLCYLFVIVKNNFILRNSLY